MALLLSKPACRLGIDKIGMALLGILLIAGCNDKKESLPFYNTADFTAEWIEPGDAGYKNIHTIDTFSLQNQLGHFINKDSLDGFIYVANFIFTTCPGICPKMVSNLHFLQDSFATTSKIKLVSFSVMPWVDSVARLKEYGESHSINPSKWYLLTGSKERIYQLGRQSYFSEKQLGLQKENSEFLHTGSMLLVDTKGRIRGIYNATEKADIARIKNDIEMLLKE